MTMLNRPWEDQEAQWFTVVGFGIAAALATWLIVRLLDAVVVRATQHSPVLSILRQAVQRPARLLLSLLALNVVTYGAPDQLPGMGVVRQIESVSLVMALTWLLIAAVGSLGDAVAVLHPLTQADNLAARRVQTQTRVLTRSMASLIALIGVAMALMTFPNVRHIGTSLLASAGLAGIVAGLAARPLLGNLIAGLQIGLTQPIRLEDVVVVEGEWGVIEEITGTYVVVKIWDQRRMIVPLEWWTQNPFQNWTRNSSAIVGTVFLWLDFSLPLASLREEFERVCKGSALWDGQVCVMQMTEANEKAMQLRCLVSSADSSKNWDLRCEVREKLVCFVQTHYPDSLPRLRVNTPQLDAGAARFEHCCVV